MALRQTYLSMKDKLLPGTETILVMRGRGNDELAPSRELLAEFNRYKAEFRPESGHSTAFHYAWETCDFERRFREEIRSRPEAMQRLRALAEASSERDIFLVCYEAEDKPCHRRILLRIAKEEFGAQVDECPFAP